MGTFNVFEKANCGIVLWDQMLMSGGTLWMLETGGEKNHLDLYILITQDDTRNFTWESTTPF